MPRRSAHASVVCVWVPLKSDERRNQREISRSRLLGAQEDDEVFHVDIAAN